MSKLDDILSNRRCKQPGCTIEHHSPHGIIKIQVKALMLELVTKLEFNIGNNPKRTPVVDSKVLREEIEKL